MFEDGRQLQVQPQQSAGIAALCVLAFASTVVGHASGIAADEFSTVAVKSTLVSGRDVGERVPQFYSRVVTGPLMNRSVCFVCRYGDRPVVMVLARKMGPELRPLLRNVDRVVEQHRAGGLRSFGVLVSDQAFPAIGSVQTFAFNNRIAMPLTVGSEVIADSSAQNIHSDAAVTVVLYHRQTVAARFAFRADELDVAHFTPVIERMKKFAAEHAASASHPEEAEAAE